MKHFASKNMFIRELWLKNWRRSVGFLKRLCFAMLWWIHIRTTEPHRWAQLFRTARFRYNCTTQRYITPQELKRLYISTTWGVSTGGCKCLSKHPNPTLGRIRKDVFIKNQSSKAISLFEIRKWQDNFLVTVHGFLMHWQAKCHCKQPDIRNIMGIHQFEVWEVLVIW